MVYMPLPVNESPIWWARVWEEPMGSHRLTLCGETETPSGENLHSWENPSPESWLCFFRGASISASVRGWVLKRKGTEQAGCRPNWAEGAPAFPASGHGSVLSGVPLAAGFHGQQPFLLLDRSPMSRARAPIQVRPRWPGLFSAFRAQELQLC